MKNESIDAKLTDNLKEKTVMVVDCGLFIEFAKKLGEKFKKVYYYVSWESGFPKMNEAFIGMGIENVERVSEMWSKFDEIDCWIFPDLYYGDFQNYLVSEGKQVWGLRKAEDLELYRDKTKQLMKKLDLPVGKYDVVKGTKLLREYLKKNNNVWVKVNCYRGNFETFFSKNYKEIEPRLDEIEYGLGAFKEILEFVVEENLDNKVEIGMDAYVIDGKYPEKTIIGCEIKDLAYIAEFRDYKDLPKEVTEFNEKIAPTLKKYGSRGFFSTEIRVGKDKKPYMIDYCARLGSPPSELYQEFYTNLAEIVWYGSKGIMINPIPIAKYGMEVLIHSNWADKNWQPIDFDMKYRQNIKLRNCCVINDRYYVIPQSVGLPEIGAIVGWGDTIEECVNMIKKAGETVTGHYIDIPYHALDKAQEEMKKTESLGIKLFS